MHAWHARGSIGGLSVACRAAAGHTYMLMCTVCFSADLMYNYYWNNASSGTYPIPPSPRKEKEKK